LVDEIELLHRKRLVLGERSIDRIAVNAMHRLPPAYQELGEPASDDSLADTALTLKDQMNRRNDWSAVRRACSVSVRIAFGHDDNFLSSNEIPALWIAIVVKLPDIQPRL
jgi:hypothetical protein